MNKNTQTFAKIAMIAAIYTVVSLVLAPFTYGNIQVRIAEALTLLPLILYLLYNHHHPFQQMPFLIIILIIFQH